MEIAAIKEELSKEIPSYMVPGYILQIEKLPLTPNGKIDRKALPPIDISAYKKEYVAPRNELEKTIVKMFKDLLGIKKIGTYDEFTLLGGTSILAIRLVYELNKKGISVDLKTIFSCQSPSKIAEYIKTQNNKMADGENRIVAKLRTSDSKLKSNLIMLPPAGGTIMGYMDMANSAKDIGDIYALEDPRLSGKEDNYSNNDEKLVEEYVSAVKSVFRPGIDYIGGHSFGGNLAFKITSELEKQGILPKGLVIIDSLPENNPDTNAYFKMSDEKLKAMVVVSVMEELLEIEETELEKMKTLTYEEVKEYLREKAKDDMMLNALLNESFLDLYVKVHTDNIRMYNEAELVEGILAIPIIVFKASQSKSNWEKYTNWTKYTNKNCQIIEVPGKHISMLRSPNVETMINHLEKIISNID
ncbi:chondramide synthase cmdD [Clostridium sp. BL-8]|nr:chondramide synthase cmdD [Clostridium sp. BL-8]